MADLIHQQEAGIVALDKMGIQRKSKRSLLDLIESQPGKDAPRKSAQPQLPSPPPKLPPLILSHLCHSKLSSLIQRGRKSKKAKTCWMLGDSALCLKKSPNGLQSNKRLYKRGREAQRGERVRHLSLRLDFQLPCSMVSP